MDTSRWDQLSDSYNKISADSRKVFLYPAMLSAIPESKELVIIDFGCACGEFTQILAKNYNNVIGYDPSRSMIKNAVTNNTVYQNIRFTDSMPTIPPNSCDVVVLSLVLQTIETEEEISKVLSDIRILLKVNGTLLVGMSHPCYNYYCIENSLYNQVGAAYPVHINSSETKLEFTDYHRPLEFWINIFCSNGLNILQCTEVYDNQEYFIEHESEIPKYSGILPLYLVFKLDNR